MTQSTDNKTRFSNVRYYCPDEVKEKVLTLQYANKEDPTYDAYKEDIAIAFFYFDKGNIMQYKRSIRVTLDDLISQVGGTLGLCLGISLLGGAEIIYWCTIRLILNRRRRKISHDNCKDLEGSSNSYPTPTPNDNNNIAATLPAVEE